MLTSLTNTRSSKVLGSVQILYQCVWGGGGGGLSHNDDTADSGEGGLIRSDKLYT